MGRWGPFPRSTRAPAGTVATMIGQQTGRPAAQRRLRAVGWYDTIKWFSTDR